MSDNANHHGNDEEAQDCPPFPNHGIPANATLANLPTTTTASTEAPDLLQGATPIGTVALSTYSWPQPRGDRSLARERGRVTHRRLPAAIRAVFTGEPEGMCILQYRSAVRL